MENCEIRLMDITRFAPTPFTELQSVEGKLAARSLNSGKILHCRLAKALPVIDKGDIVSIRLNKGRISVAVTGIARERGGIGDRIWVKNRKTNKLIRAQILDRGVVTVEQGGRAI